MVSANYESYKSVMRQAYKDGQITPEESAILDTLRQSLNISSAEHEQIENEVKQEIANGGAVGANSVSSEPIPSEPPADNFDENVIRPGMNPTENVLDSMGGVPDNPSGAMETETVESAPAAAESAEPQTIEEMIKAGKGAYHKSDFQMAISYFDKALEQEPDNSEALFFRKRAHSKLSEIGGGAADTAGAGMPSGGAVANPSGADGGIAGVSPGMGGSPAAGGAKGDPNCTSCNGAGTCRWCKSTGGCYWCKGTGQCDKCKGTGITKGQQCSSCAGSGKCHSCKGNGKCYWCQGSGRCNKCSM